MAALDHRLGPFYRRGRIGRQMAARRPARGNNRRSGYRPAREHQNSAGRRRGAGEGVLRTLVVREQRRFPLAGMRRRVMRRTRRSGSARRAQRGLGQLVAGIVSGRSTGAVRVAVVDGQYCVALHRKSPVEVHCGIRCVASLDLCGALGTGLSGPSSEPDAGDGFESLRPVPRV